jgi:putative DNA primase/helicase
MTCSCGADLAIDCAFTTGHLDLAASGCLAQISEDPGDHDSYDPAPGVSVVPPPSDPMAVARRFVHDNYLGVGGTLLLRHHRNTFYRFTEDCWPEDDDRRVLSELWRWLEHAVYVKSEALVPFQPNKFKIANVLEALKAIGHIPEAVQAPVWLEGDRTVPINAGEVVPLANGILHFSTRQLLPHSPELFAQYVLPFAFDPKAPPPVRWHQFLAELWQDDEESKDALREWFGYVLSADTSQQKMFLLVGPKRSGKGTIARVLTGLLGAHNTTAPTLAGLTQNFGLQALIGKPLAVISDARLGSRSDNMIAVERLLSISGEDTITVDRKYRDPWTGRLPTRFMILTNELPRFSDSSGALASRFVMSILSRSFYGCENPALTGELLEEAPGIFNWALEGLDRLRERGYFLTPGSAQEAQRHLEDLASPVGAFVRDRCRVGPDLIVDKDDLWAVWKEWCSEEGAHPGTKAVFVRNLRASVPDAIPQRPIRNGRRVHVIAGLEIGPAVDLTPDIPDEKRHHVTSQRPRQVSLLAQPSGPSGMSGIPPHCWSNSPNRPVKGRPALASSRHVTAGAA